MASGPLGRIHVHVWYADIIRRDWVTLCQTLRFCPAVTRCPVLGQRKLEKGFVIG